MVPDEAVSAAVEAALELPQKTVLDVARAARAGITSVQALATTGPASSKVVCLAVAKALKGGVDGERMGGLLEGAAAAAREVHRRQRVDVIWTGPSSATQLSRLTSASLLEVIAAAEEDLLIIGYAVHKQAQVVSAVAAALGRGVVVTTLFERQEDNASFHGGSDPFVGLPVRRLRWPAEQRSGTAALHAKVLVADRNLAMIGSANITDWAFERNIECGVLIRGGGHPGRIRDRVEDLLHEGVLVRA